MSWYDELNQCISLVEDYESIEKNIKQLWEHKKEHFDRSVLESKLAGFFSRPEVLSLFSWELDFKDLDYMFYDDRGLVRLYTNTTTESPQEEIIQMLKTAHETVQLSHLTLDEDIILYSFLWDDRIHLHHVPVSTLSRLIEENGLVVTYKNYDALMEERQQTENDLHSLKNTLLSLGVIGS